jgi:hypothetical protein
MHPPEFTTKVTKNTKNILVSVVRLVFKYAS